jgi:hypothetical protein
MVSIEIVSIEMVPIEMLGGNIATSTRAMLLRTPRAVDTRLPREAVSGCGSSMQAPIRAPRSPTIGLCRYVPMPALTPPSGPATASVRLPSSRLSEASGIEVKPRTAREGGNPRTLEYPLWKTILSRVDFSSAAAMPEMAGRYGVDTRHDGIREQKFCRVQNGYGRHQIIVLTPSRTTARLYFSCSLQANDSRSGREVPSLDCRTIEPGDFVFDGTPVAARAGLPRRRVSVVRAGGPGSPGRPPDYHSPCRSYINDARRPVALED